MNNTYPCIKVNDIETTISWYADFLGFQCKYKSSLKNPEYAVIKKGNLKIYLTKDADSYASNVIVIEVADIKSEYQALKSGGAIIIQPPGQGAFSEKEFVLKDYEDNKIIYTQKT